MGISIHNISVSFILASAIIVGSCRDHNLPVIDIQPSITVPQSSDSLLEDRGEIQIMTPTPDLDNGTLGSQANADVIFVHQWLGCGCT